MPHRQRPRVAALEGFRKLRVLGQGSDGPSWLCERRSDKKLVVRKSYDRWVKDNGRPLEPHILQHIVPNHPRILQCDAWSEFENNTLEVYFEYYEGGDLARFIKSHERCHESFVWHVFVQIAEALAFLHYGYRRDHPNTVPSHWQRVIHRDVKPDNIFFRKKFVSGGGFPPLVLGDFGIATLRSTTNDGSGTAPWQGPEWPIATAKSDIWGLGAIIHALTHGDPPQRPVPPEYKAAGKKGKAAWNRNPRSKNPQPLTTRYSQRLSDNMMRCLTTDSGSRIDSRTLVQMLVKDRAIWQARQ